MAHTPKPIRKTLKRLRREGRRPSDSAITITSRAIRGRTIHVDEAWTFAPSGASCARVIDLSKSGHLTPHGLLEPLDIVSRGRSRGRGM